jgi:hypothetical protein
MDERNLSSDFIMLAFVMRDQGLNAFSFEELVNCLYDSTEKYMKDLEGTYSGEKMSKAKRRQHAIAFRIAVMWKIKEMYDDRKVQSASEL